MANAWWKKCSVDGCEATVCVTTSQWAEAKCEKHRRQEEVERAIDRAHDEAK